MQRHVGAAGSKNNCVSSNFDEFWALGQNLEYYYPLTLHRKAPLAPQKMLNTPYPTLNSLLNTTLRNFRRTKHHLTSRPVKLFPLLDDIIPNEYFGLPDHRRLFYRIVKLILTQSVYECIHVTTITKGYNLNDISWLRTLPQRELILRKANIFFLEQVKRFITFVYKPYKTRVGHEIKLVRLERWARFEDGVFERIKKLGYLEKTNEGSPRGLLTFVPKGELEELRFRPIIRNYPDNRTPLSKNLIEKIYRITRNDPRNLSMGLYQKWAEFVETSKEKKLYGVKLDIKDAFGTVDIDLLQSMISRHIKSFTKAEYEFLSKHIQNQIVVFRKKTYRWKHGLVQGDILSAPLCELYLTNYDAVLHDQQLIPSDCLAHRSVDDYLICSTNPSSLKELETFISSLSHVNHKKTDHQEILPYFGKLFDLTTKQIRTAHSFPPNYEIRHKFKLWNEKRQISYNNPELHLSKAMQFSFCNNYFNRFMLNTRFNTLQTALENYFDGMVFVAYKFDATVMTLRNNSPVDGMDFVARLLKKCVVEFACRAKDRFERFKEGNYRKFGVKTLKALGFRAFLLVLKRRSEVYKGLIKKIKEEEKLKIWGEFGELQYFFKLPEGLNSVKISRRCLF